MTKQEIILASKEHLFPSVFHYFKEPLVVKNGYMDLPNKPGFGVELKEDVAKRFPYLPGAYSKPNPDLPS